MKSISRKEQGLFFTPDWVVDLMIDMVEVSQKPNQELRILEPACGFLQFIKGYVKKADNPYPTKKLVGVEIDPKIIKNLKSEDEKSEVKVVNADYLLWESDTKFDIIIGNPPYGIPSPNEHYSIRVDNNTKRKYKSIYETWYGKYNLYGAFIEKSVKLLREGGQLLFIVPATFIMLDEFKILRRFLSEMGYTRLIYMGTDVFKPEADVVTLIINFKKGENNRKKLELWEYFSGKKIINHVIDDWEGGVITFKSKYARALQSICSYNLGEIYDVKISPRTTEIKGNKNILHINPQSDQYFPILNSRNLKRENITYNNLSGYWISKENLNGFRGYFGKSHIVVGLGFRGSGKLASAYDEKSYPWMGDVYHLLRKNDLFTSESGIDDIFVSEFLNSDFIARFINDVFRDVTYHFSITQLKLIPIPTYKELEKMREEYNGFS